MKEQITEEFGAGISCQLFTAPAIQFYWPLILEQLEKIPHMFLNETPDSLLEKALQTRVQVWGVGVGEQWKMFIFTQVAIHPARNCLEIVMCFGEGVLEKVGPVVSEAMDQFALSQSCKDIEVFGRPGWEKILAPYGFRKLSVVLSRPVLDRSIN